MKRSLHLLWAVCLACLVMAGCTHNQLKIDDAGQVTQTTSPANVSRMDAEGNQVAAYQGLAPTVIKQDSEGNWVNVPGPVALLSYVPATGQVYLMSPNDATLKGIKFTPQPAAGQPAFEAAEITLNLSEPLKQHVAAFAQAASALVGMTQIEATATVERMKAAGEITATIAEALLTYFVPTLAP